MFYLHEFLAELKKDGPILVEETTEMCSVFYYSPHTTTVIHPAYDSYVATLPDNDHGFSSQCVNT
jgi:hypothetical protein